jgi:hypothetical protein
MSQQQQNFNFLRRTINFLGLFVVLPISAAPVEAEKNPQRLSENILKETKRTENLITSTNATTSVVVDGMILNLRPSHFQRVKIRLTSMGPGGCVTRVILAGDYRELPAPPFVWTNWYEIGPAFSGGAHALTFQPLCDTGSLGEVMYDAE